MAETIVPLGRRPAASNPPARAESKTRRGSASAPTQRPRPQLPPDRPEFDQFTELLPLHSLLWRYKALTPHMRYISWYAVEQVIDKSLAIIRAAEEKSKEERAAFGGKSNHLHMATPAEDAEAKRRGKASTPIWSEGV